MLKHYFYFFALTISASLYGQNTNNITSVQDSYAKYFEIARENIYLHFNKSEYVFGEEIWFKGYIYDQINEIPSNLTANVHIDIYNSSGTLIKSELFLGFNGFVRGSFLIDNTLTTGTYYIKAYTNWMKNFIEDNAYSTQIHIINETEVKQDVAKANPLKYDIQFLPESGYALEGIHNNLGVKITDAKGKGIAIESGIIIENDSIEISSFKTNRFGIGNAIVLFEKGKTYSAKITLKSGLELNQYLPKPETNGVNFNAKTSLKNNIYLSFNKTVTTPGNTFKLLIHKDGFSRTVNIRFKDELKTTVSFSKSNLFDGVNILTLFNENNQPVAERLIYHHSSTNSKKLKLTYRKKDDDSLQFNISLPRDLENYYNLSVSVLPFETTSYNHTDNIISKFKLSPYVSGHVENPKYYFTNTNSETLYDLDLLLLTQGWSRYLWDYIFNNKPTQKYRFEYGLSLKGQIESKNQEIQSVLMSNLINSRVQSVKVDTSGSFRINNIFPYKNEFIRLSFNLDKRRKKDNNTLLRPKVEHELLGFSSLNETIDVNTIISQPINFNNQDYIGLNSFIVNNNVILNRAFALDGKNKPIESQPVKRGRSIIIQEIDYSNTNLLKLLRSNGFTINKTSDKVVISSPKTTINPYGKAPDIYVDDALIDSADALSVIDIKLVDEVLIDPYASSGVSLYQNGGEIRIYTRKAPLPNVNQSSKFPLHTIKAEKGFTPNKIFYNPKYAFYSTSSYKKYGVIHWFSDLLVSGSTRFKIPDHNQRSIRFYVEGMSDTGNLVSEVITVTIPEEN